MEGPDDGRSATAADKAALTYEEACCEASLCVAGFLRAVFRTGVELGARKRRTANAGQAGGLPVAVAAEPLVRGVALRAGSAGAAAVLDGVGVPWPRLSWTLTHSEESSGSVRNLHSSVMRPSTLMIQRIVGWVVLMPVDSCTTAASCLCLIVARQLPAVSSSTGLATFVETSGAEESIERLGAYGPISDVETDAALVKQEMREHPLVHLFSTVVTNSEGMPLPHVTSDEQKFDHVLIQGHNMSITLWGTSSGRSCSGWETRGGLLLLMFSSLPRGNSSMNPSQRPWVRRTAPS